MIWKKNKLKPTQPYLELYAENFQQKVILQNGISYFYQFDLSEDMLIPVVPDGCINFLFVYSHGSMSAYVCGTKPQYTQEQFFKGTTFGVCFMLGLQPDFIGVKTKTLLGNRMELVSILLGEKKWLDDLADASTFEERIQIFLDSNIALDTEKKGLFGKKQLFNNVKQLMYDSDGKIRIGEIQELSGYTNRYINKVFLEEMGYSPKTFCKIIQFQRAIEFLNDGSKDKMTDAAVELGYYDQPQFIRDFKRYAGITPKKYQQLRRREEYREKFDKLD